MGQRADCSTRSVHLRQGGSREGVRSWMARLGRHRAGIWLHFSGHLWCRSEHGAHQRCKRKGSRWELSFYYRAQLWSKEWINGPIFILASRVQTLLLSGISGEWLSSRSLSRRNFKITALWESARWWVDGHLRGVLTGLSRTMWSAFGRDKHSCFKNLLS